MIIPKRILLAAVHYPVSSGGYMTRAFKRIGCDVRSVGPFTGDWLPWNGGMNVKPEYAWKSDGNLDAYWEDWRPDLVVLMDSAFQYHSSYADVPHVVYGVDSHVVNYRQPGIEHYFLAHSQGPAHCVCQEDESWLPCGYDPVYFTPSPIPMAERQYDVCMIGVIYQRRADIIRAMVNAGLSVFAGTGLLYDDYAAAYHDSRISLCVSAAGDVAQRVFETAAMGCAVLTDHCADLDREELSPIHPPYGIRFHTTEETLIATQMMLSDFGFLSEMGHNAEKWARPHTWDARAQTILDTMFGAHNAT